MRSQQKALLISSIVRHAGIARILGLEGHLYPTRNKLVIDGNGLVDFRLGWADCNLEHEVNWHGSLGSGASKIRLPKVFVAGAFATLSASRCGATALLATRSGGQD